MGPVPAILLGKTARKEGFFVSMKNIHGTVLSKNIISYLPSDQFGSGSTGSNSYKDPVQASSTGERVLPLTKINPMLSVGSIRMETHIMKSKNCSTMVVGLQRKSILTV